MKYLTLIAGILLLIFSTMHFFSGYPMVNSLLEADSASSNLSHIVRVIWHFSSMSMLLMATWAFFIYNNGNPKYQCLVLGGACILFGGIGFFHPLPNWHLLMFALPGLLILLPGFF